MAVATIAVLILPLYAHATSYNYFDDFHTGSLLSNVIPTADTTVSGTTFSSVHSYAIAKVNAILNTTDIYATSTNSGYGPGSTDVSTLGLTTGEHYIFAGVGSGDYCFFDWNGSSISTGTCNVPPVTLVVPDTRTRIIDFSPADNSTTTNPVTFTMHAFVNSADVGTFIGVKLTLHNIDQNVLFGGLVSFLNPNDIYFLDGFTATSSGDFYFATTTTVAEGNYRLNAILERSYLGGWITNPFAPISQDLSHQFIIGQPTFIGNLSQAGFSELNGILGTYGATSTLALAKTCNPLAGDVSTFFLSQLFDPIKCLSFLFIPDAGALSNSTKALRDGVLVHVPIGYVTRMYNIWSGSSTSSLPSFTATIQIGPGNTNTPATTALSFDPGDMVAGGGALLDSIHDPINNKTARDIFEPMIRLTVALAVAFTIFSDLTGSHRHHTEIEKRPQKLS